MKSLFSRLYYGWYIVGVLTIANFTQVGEFNPVLAVFIKPFGDDFGWSRAEVALAITLGSFGGGLTGPLVGPIIDRLGARTVLVVCQIIYGTCLLSLTWLNGSLLHFIVAYSFGRLVVQGGAALSVQAAIANWFSLYRGKAMGITVLGTRLGQAILPAGVALIAETWHWRYGFAMLGGAALIMAVLPTLLIVRRKPEDLGLLPDGATRPPTRTDTEPIVVIEESGWELRDVWRTRSFWCLVGASSLSFFVGAGINLHLYPYMQDAGLDTGRAVTVASLFFGTGAIGSMIWGALLDRFPLRNCLTLDFLLSTVGITLLLTATTFEQGIAFAIVYGLCFGGLFTMVSVMWAAYYGRKNVGAISGASLPFQLTVNALGPLWAGWLYDIQGNYHLAFGVFLGMAVVAAALVWLAGPPRPAPLKTARIA